MPTDGTPGCRQRPRKRGRAYELPTRQEFEKYRSEWLGRIPQNVKSRFREGGRSGGRTGCWFVSLVSSTSSPDR